MLVMKSALIRFIKDDLRNDEHIFYELLRILEQHFEVFKSAQGDAEKLKRIAHKMKSGCATFSAIQLVAHIDNLEFALANSDWDSVQHEYKKLVDCMQPSIDEIRKIADSHFSSREKKQA